MFPFGWLEDPPATYSQTVRINPQNSRNLGFETGEPLPRELYLKLCEQKTYQAGMTMVRQLFFGKLDMELHGSYDPTSAGAPTPFEVQQQLRVEELLVVARLQEEASRAVVRVPFVVLAHHLVE